MQHRYLTFDEAADLLPGRQRPAYATWWRWWRHGVRGIRLRTRVIGGRRYTTPEDLEAFVAATTAAANGQPSPARTSRQRERATREAQRLLRENRIIAEEEPNVNDD